MTALLRRRPGRDEDRDRGFTLIELLVVVVIIGVLIAIAVPLYSNYKKGAANTSASSDVRGAISAVEQFYTANGNTYPKDVTGTKGSNVTLEPESGSGTNGTITVSEGNTIRFENLGSSYVICGQNTDGGTIYFYNSATSKSVSKSSASSLAACVTSASGTATPAP